MKQPKIKISARLDPGILERAKWIVASGSRDTLSSYIEGALEMRVTRDEKRAGTKK